MYKLKGDPKETFQIDVFGKGKAPTKKNHTIVSRAIHDSMTGMRVEGNEKIRDDDDVLQTFFCPFQELL